MQPSGAGKELTKPQRGKNLTGIANAVDTCTTQTIVRNLLLLLLLHSHLTHTHTHTTTCLSLPFSLLSRLALVWFAYLKAGCIEQRFGNFHVCIVLATLDCLLALPHTTLTHTHIDMHTSTHTGESTWCDSLTT